VLAVVLDWSERVFCLNALGIKAVEKAWVEVKLSILASTPTIASFSLYLLTLLCCIFAKMQREKL